MTDATLTRDELSMLDSYVASCPPTAFALGVGRDQLLALLAMARRALELEGRRCETCRYWETVSSAFAECDATGCSPAADWHCADWTRKDGAT